MSNYFEGPWSHRDYSAERLQAFRRVFPERVSLFDLGAAGGTPPPFLFLRHEIRTVNFEPDKRAVTEGNQQCCPIAIGPSELTRIYLNRRPTTSSLLPPNRRITDRYDWSRLFGDSSNIFETVAEEPIATHPLDQAVAHFKLEPPDFLKIDVQGLSLEVLMGAARTIAASVCGIEVEVEFLESYAGQKTMGAIHEYIQSLGFEIFRLKNLNSWFYKTELKLSRFTGQDTFCDLVYFRNLDSVDALSGFWTPARAERHLQLMLLYDLTDAAAAFFEAFRRKGYLAGDRAREIESFICAWPGAVDYFYEPRRKGMKDHLKRVLSVSPLDVLRFFRSKRRAG